MRKTKLLLAFLFMAFVEKGVAQGCDNFTLVNPKAQYCVGEPIMFEFQGSSSGSDYLFVLDMDECVTYTVGALTFGNPPISKTISHVYNRAGTYNVTISWCSPTVHIINVVDCNYDPDGDNGNTPDPNTTLASCNPEFSPPPGEYLLSFWVREDKASMAGVITYTSGVRVVCSTYSGPVTTNIYANGIFNSGNRIIDGWQKVEQRITIPSNVTGISLQLMNNSSPGVDVYFDDIRFHPFNSTFKSYVYDPVTLRLSAELDERNYATFYEYDEEGQLTRVKKETEKGIKTIKETRTGVSK